MRRAILLALAVSASPLIAADKKPLTVDDMWAVQRVGTPALSPDGKALAYTVSVYDMEENRSNGDLWVVPLAGGTPRRLTTNKASDGSPAWSPDGKRLAFTSKRDDDKVNQLYVIPIDGGEPERMTEMPLAVTNPMWLPDGKRIAFVSHMIAGAESPADTKKALEAREKNKVKARVTENRLFRFWDRWLTDNEFPHVFVVDLATRKVTDLLPGSKRLFSLQEGIGSLDVSPDGKWIAFEANSTPEPYRTLNTDVFLVPTSGGEVKNLTASNPASDGDPVFSPDGKKIAYGIELKADGWPDWTRLAVMDVAGGSRQVLTEPMDISASSWAWSDDGRTIVFHAESRARTNLYAIPASGGTAKEIHHGGTTAGAEVSADGQVVTSRPRPSPNWIEGHTDRFRALVSHAGVYSLLGQSASDAYYGRQHSYGGYPFTNLEIIERWSPDRYAKNFSTPMLVVHGERDFRVPVTQGLALYGVLTTKGVPARLVYYPDENHWVLKGQNSKHWYGEVLGWLARWLK